MEKIILHACCAPCASYPIKKLIEDNYEPVVFFYNPNIFPYKEYEIRKNELENYCNKNNIAYFQEKYNIKEYISQERTIHLFLDKYSSNRSNLVKSVAKLLNIKLIYLPPYSPHLNPIEQVWRLIKRELKHHYIYSEDYTIVIFLGNSARGEVGFYDLYLYYYNDDRLNGNYDVIKPVVEFANEITNILAYDTQTEENQFEKLYYEALSSDDKFASNYYHFDNSVGNVGYLVFLKPEFSETGYYYMLQKKGSLKPCFYFRFEGLLKPFDVE